MKRQERCIILALMFLSILFTIYGCKSSNSSPPPDNPIDTATYSISGTIKAPVSAVMDNDVNDVSAPYSSNDEADFAQSIRNPVTVNGYVNVAGSGPSGRSQVEGDVVDLYNVMLATNQIIMLFISDAQEAGILDLDLYLLDSSGSIVDSSESTSGAIELLTVPSSGTYFIAVIAEAGASNYILTIGQDITSASAEALRLSDDFIPGEVIVRFKDTPLPANRNGALLARAASVGMLPKAGAHGREMLLSLGDEENRTIMYKSLDIRQRFSASSHAEQLKLDTITAVKALRQRTDVVSADLNYVRKAFAAPNDSFYSSQWHYPLINLPQAWDISTGDSNVIVAVIDTGVLLNHPDLQGQLIAGYDFISDPSNALDGNGIDNNPDDPGDQSLGGSSFHGTHVAGTIAAATNNADGVAGIAWSAKIMPLRVLGKGGADDYDIMQAIRYAAGLNNDSKTVPNRRADIINLSLGGYGSSQTQQDVLTEARNAGVIIIAAAANDSTSNPSYPASYDGVVSVSAVDMERNLAPYSNYGQFIDVAAPGGDSAVDKNGDGYQDGVLSTGGDDSRGAIEYIYKFEQGTSMATPHMAGVVALMKAVYPGLTPNDLDTILANGNITVDLGNSGRDDKFGYGLIDAYKAVVEAKKLSNGTQPTPNPTLVVNPSSLNLGSTLTTATISVTNSGGGTLTMNSLSDDAGWLSVSPATVDTDGFGTYTVAVNRSGLPVGIYTARITITSSVNTVTVPVIMQVLGSTVTGNAGYHYVLLVDPETFESKYQVEVDINNGIYTYNFTDVPGGAYYIYAGSDPNNDEYICDFGEACGAYITLDQPEPITVDSDLTGLDFHTQFEINLGIYSASADSQTGQKFPRLKVRKIREE